MCLLIAKPAGKVVPEAYLRHSAERNNDGLGVVWRTPGSATLSLWKDANTTPASIAELCQRVAALTDVDALIHFRLATHGECTHDNTHPMWVGDDQRMAMAHNGVIHSLSTNKKVSDTKQFADHILSYLREDWWNNPVTREAVERILSGDRCALLHAEKGIILLNERSFTTEDGVMYSNTMYRPYVPVPYAPTKMVHHRRHSQTATEEPEWQMFARQRSIAPPVLPKTADQDLLVGLFVFGTPDKSVQVLCVKCCTTADMNPSKASPILASELDFLGFDACKRCNKPLTDVATEVIRDRTPAATTSPVTTEPTAPVGTTVSAVPPVSIDSTEAGDILPFGYGEAEDSSPYAPTPPHEVPAITSMTLVPLQPQQEMFPS